MRVCIIGAGPGGLYAAILLKKAHTEHDIQIYERNPDGATYGWGVVFSDRTLNSFREADAVSYQQIIDSFVQWTAIDIHYRGQVIRADGHDFAGMSRRRLLQILQDRCRVLGVGLTFETEVVLLAPQAPAMDRGDENTRQMLENTGRDRNFSPSGLPITEIDPRDYDVVIAADGINSRVRSDFAHAFKPSVSAGRAKFVWFGTDKVLDAFTFIFKDNEHGLFQVHAYPFDGQTSTFIVECEEDVWRRAGLDRASEADSIAYCEDLFSDFLCGASLMSNRSLWGSFIRVKTQSWRHGNIVLVGDAAHTAHFSIGSGTKLAMDGAIALARSFEMADDLHSALRLYDMDHRPRVDALQAAADESREYFENVRRYTHLEPPQFAFHLLTRSGRIHYDNLRTRDPFYIDSVDRWFQSPRPDQPKRIAPPPMFTPFALRDMTLENRIAVSGDISRAAQTGAALVMTPPIAVTEEGRITPGDAGLYNAKHTAEWKRALKIAHRAGAVKTAALLNHAGRRGATLPRDYGMDRPIRSGAWPLLAPSAIPYHSRSQTPRAMRSDDFVCVRDSFVQAAHKADQVGFDMLHLHMGHGYLLASFLSPLTNQRKDKYGGSSDKRMRFPLEVFDAVRAAWPADKPLGVALNVDDCAKGGIALGEAVEIGRILRKHGCDLLEVLIGQTIPHDSASYGPGFLTSYADVIRQEVGLPVLVGGYLTTSGEVNTILAGGRADLCLMANL